jgi:hypothetical protein
MPWFFSPAARVCGIGGSVGDGPDDIVCCAGVGSRSGWVVLPETAFSRGGSLSLRRWPILSPPGRCLQCFRPFFRVPVFCSMLGAVLQQVLSAKQRLLFWFLSRFPCQLTDSGGSCIATTVTPGARSCMHSVLLICSTCVAIAIATCSHLKAFPKILAVAGDRSLGSSQGSSPPF